MSKFSVTFLNFKLVLIGRNFQTLTRNFDLKMILKLPYKTCNMLEQSSLNCNLYNSLTNQSLNFFMERMDSWSFGIKRT